MTVHIAHTTGRRKRAVARVRVRIGTGTITVNGRSIEDFFPSDTHRMIITEPLRNTKTETASILMQLFMEGDPAVKLEL